jgi:uncharacterized membrane protein YgcG
MRRVVMALAAGVLAGSGLALASPAQAATDRITRMDVEVSVDTDGVMSVTQTVDVAYASSGHGLYVWFITRQRYDDTRDRIYTYSDFAVTSPTGAPTDLDETRQANATRLRIGDPSVTVRGQQRYVVTYTVAGLVNPDVAASGLDEIYWNVIGTDWEIPIANLTVTIRGPQDVTQTACQTGPGFAEECTSHQAGAAGRFTQDELSPGAPLAVIGGWPAGTFPGATIELEEIPDQQRANDIIDYDALIDLSANGQARVTETVTVAGPLRGGGLATTLATRSAWDGDHDRRWSYHDLTVTTTAGTALDFTVDESDDTLTVILAHAEQAKLGGTFVLSYTVDALVATHRDGSGADAVDWHLATERWQADLQNVTVTMRGPAPPTGASCAVHPSNAPCRAVDGSGPVAAFQADTLSLFRTDRLVVSATWPTGTFAANQPSTILLNPSAWDLRDGAPGALGAGAACLVAVGLLVLMGRSGRDKQWATTPGEIPGPGEAVEVIRRTVRDAPVRFSPPDLPPRLAGALARGATSTADVTATLVALAVKGHLLIEAISKRAVGVRVIGTGPAGLDPVETRICDLLWTMVATHGRRLSTKTFAATASAIAQTLRREWEQRSWFEEPPRSVVRRWRARAWQVTVWGVIAAISAGLTVRDRFPGLGWYAAAFLILGVGMAILAGRMPVHTPLGSALLVQTLGFKKYLATAEADQLRWEEGQDIFSEYLPYAIAFGCAERWTKLFDPLVARGAPVKPLAWAGIPDVTQSTWRDLTASIDRLDTSTRRASNYSPGGSGWSRSDSSSSYDSSSGSSGSSGFSSSGGGGGGGAGGGGGGTW